MAGLGRLEGRVIGAMSLGDITNLLKCSNSFANDANVGLDFEETIGRKGQTVTAKSTRLAMLSTILKKSNMTDILSATLRFVAVCFSESARESRVSKRA
jgi:hypothetical protein